MLAGVRPLPCLPPLPAGWRRDSVIIAAVFLGIRFLVLAIYHLRGRHFPFIDADGYIRHAAWLAQHGTFVMPEVEGARYFSGMPLIVSLLGRLTCEFAWTGVAVNAIAGIGAALLFYRNFPRRDWGVWHAALLPAWVSMTATFHSEAGLWFFALIGLTAVRLPLADRRRLPLLVVAGYALACRPTAVFIIGPILLTSLLHPRATRTFIFDLLAVGLLPAALFAWIRVEAGQFFPQSAWQAREFAWWAVHYGGDFPSGVFAWPGQSFIAGLFSPGVRPSIKLLNGVHLLVWLGGLLLAARTWRKNPADTLAALTSLELAANGLFVLTIGGPFGHVIFYRFLATQANAFLVLSWLRHSRMPSTLWWMASAGSVALAAAASGGN